MLWAGLWKYSELDWCNLNELLGNRVIGWTFSVQGPPSTFRMGSKLAAKKFLLQFQVPLLHLRRAKILLQRTRELTLFTGLIPAQAIKFLPSQQPLQFRLEQCYLLLPALNCRRAFLRPLEELLQLTPRDGGQTAAAEALLTCKTLQLLC